MSFNSWDQFWSMGGYAYFVWMSFGFTFLVLALEVLIVYWRHQAQRQQRRHSQQLSQKKQGTP